MLSRTPRTVRTTDRTSLLLRPLSLALLGGMALVAACGGGSTTSTGTTGATTSTTTTTVTTGTGGTTTTTGTGGTTTTTGTGGTTTTTGTGGGTTTGTGGMATTGTGGMGGTTAGTGGTGGVGGIGGMGGTGGVAMVCVPSSTAPCYTGPMGTEGQGPCVAGTKTCDALGSAYGACVGQVLPKAEDCTTAIDEDCNGLTPACPGSTLWAKLQGDTVDDEGNGLAVDPSGNVLFGGYATLNPDLGCGPHAIGPSFSAVLVKYSANGSCLWSKAFSTGNVNDSSDMRDITTDGQGNVYVTGIFDGAINLGGGILTSASPAESDVFVAKFDPMGNHIWSKGFGASAAQVSKGIRLDSQGNIYVVGMFFNQINFGPNVQTNLTSLGNLDVYLAKLTNAGTHVWSKRFGGVGAQAAYALTIDAANNVTFTGTVFGTINFGGVNLTSMGLGDIYVARLNSAGTHVWSQRFGDGGDQAALGIAGDPAGNFTLAGNFTGTMDFGGGNIITSISGIDAWAARFTSNGSSIWAKAGGGLDAQIFNAVAVDGMGNSVAAGQIKGSADYGCGMVASAGASDTVMVKYSPAGDCVWSKVFGGPSTELARSVAIDATGASYSTGPAGPTDFGMGLLPGNGGEEIYIVKLAP